MSSEKIRSLLRAPNAETLKKDLSKDYYLVSYSREIGRIVRKEVLNGRAKFGIAGDGKELAQIALAKCFEKGDIRSGYYRDQTLMMATNQVTGKQILSQLYAHADVSQDPASAGRQMACHFSTRLLDEKGEWKDYTQNIQSIADLSPTSGQIPRILGLGLASKFHRSNKFPKSVSDRFSKNGNEVIFGTLGDASTSQGSFLEFINAAAVLQIPVVMSIWDNGYGISVPKKYQTAKESISKALRGFEADQDHKGFDIFSVKGWDYPALIETYQTATSLARKNHRPVLVHVEEMTQPSSHSTSSDHRMYKEKKQLEWEHAFDCVRKMESWLLDLEDKGTLLFSKQSLDDVKARAISQAHSDRKDAFTAYEEGLCALRNDFVSRLEDFFGDHTFSDEINQSVAGLRSSPLPLRSDTYQVCKKILRHTPTAIGTPKVSLKKWLEKQLQTESERYNSYLYSRSEKSFERAIHTAIEYASDPSLVDGRVVLQKNFDKLLEKHPELLFFGEDVGLLGGVNRSLEGLQNKYGIHRVFDTGIRETSIIGKAMGLSMRGFRPVPEIQYLDYIYYALPIIADDIATLHYRTAGGQKAPIIIRTRGHRLEGIWHSGSPIGVLTHAARGIYILTPRNFVQAAGFYNTLMQCDNPAIVIEPLNGYRKKEPLPLNLGSFTTPIGKVELLNRGTDVTVISYGSTLNLVSSCLPELEGLGISCDLIDAQSIAPFDLDHQSVASLKKTNRLVIVDEDVPGGASAYLLQKVLEEQKGYNFLDSPPITICAKEHRPAYGSDGNYFSKPSADDIVETIYEMMHESDPRKYPLL